MSCLDKLPSPRIQRSDAAKPMREAITRLLPLLQSQPANVIA